MTERLIVDAAHPEPHAIARGADALRSGRLVAFPTETVYGLGGHALDREAVRRIFEAKGRPANDPLIVHVADLGMLDRLIAERPSPMDALAAQFWPGPLTIVLPRSNIVPDEVTAGLDTVAIRMPAHPVARALLDVVALPIAAPSANLFSRPSPTRAEHVLEDLDGRIDLVLDAGPTTVGVESTVLDLTAQPATVLRPGAVTLEMLRHVLSDVQAAEPKASTGSMKSPGLLDRHYSPRAPLTLYEGASPSRVAEQIERDAANCLARGQRVGLILAAEDLITTVSEKALVERLGPAAKLELVAANLYSALRALDAAHVDVILARSFDTDAGLGAALRDRLYRAAAGRVVIV